MLRRKALGGLAVCWAVAVMGGCQASLSQINFVAPKNMKVDVLGAEQAKELILPARLDLKEGTTTRLKLDDIPSHPGLTVWATIQVTSRATGLALSADKTANFRDHCAIPIVFEADDFDQVMANNQVTKVVYLPKPEFQEVSLGGVDVATEMLVSTRLEPGMDAVKEASKKGTVLAIIQMGNREF